MKTTPDFYDIRLTHDETIAALVALKARIEEMSKNAAEDPRPNGARYWREQARIAQSAHDTIMSTRPVSIDDMEKEATK